MLEVFQPCEGTIKARFLAYWQNRWKTCLTDIILCLFTLSLLCGHNARLPQHSENHRQYAAGKN
jgi:hypothetical protein